MKLYHYTSIKTLASILESQAIKFNRLDQVDDMEECGCTSGPTNTKLGKYAFVSCWTKDPIENIALWKMYTDLKGVRIGLDSDMFITYDVGTVHRSYFCERQHIIKDYVISSYLNSVSPIDINYVEDIRECAINLIESSEKGIWIKTDKIGTFKSKQWEFQKESRFIIIAQPAGYDMALLPFPNIKDLLNNKEISDNEFFIPLKPNVFQDAEIILAPKTDHSDMIIVKSLISTYCKNYKGIIKSSNFKIRK